MSLGDVSLLLAVFTLALYFIVGTVLLKNGWPIRAGLGMATVSLAPLLWQAIFTNSDAPGFAFLLMVMLPPAFGLMLLGLIWWIYRRLVPTDN